MLIVCRWRLGRAKRG